MRWTFTLLCGLLVVHAPAPLAAQAIVGLEKTPKPVTPEPREALARLRDGWHAAALAAGESAGPAATAETLVRMIHEPIKIVGLAADIQRLKSALRDVETRVRAVGLALEQGTLSLAAASAEAQRALDSYLIVLGARLEPQTPVPAGADRR